MPDTTPSNPMYELVDLTLDAVALCKEGANTRADIILTKRKENKNMPVTYEELMASLKPENVELINKKITADLAAKDTIITGLQNELDGLKKANKPEPTEDEVLKTASPEVKALISSLQKSVSTLVSERADEIAATRFEKCKALPVEEKELKEVLKTVSPATYAILEKAASLISQKALEGKGADAGTAGVGSSADAAYSQLEKSAQDLMAKQSDLTFEKAFSKACESNPDVFKKYSERMR